MNDIRVSTRCTREEYMVFAVQRQKKSLWPPLIGVGLVTAGLIAVVITRAVHQTTLLCLFAGVLLLLCEPLIRPLMIKGQAARTYDASDSLRAAMSVCLTADTVHIKSVCVEATLPTEAITETVITQTAVALYFGKELSVCLPLRAFSEEEKEALLTHPAITKEIKG